MSIATVVSIETHRDEAIELSVEVVELITAAVHDAAEQLGYEFFVHAVCDRSESCEIEKLAA